MLATRAADKSFYANILKIFLLYGLNLFKCECDSQLYSFHSLVLSATSICKLYEYRSFAIKPNVTCEGYMWIGCKHFSIQNNNIIDPLCGWIQGVLYGDYFLRLCLLFISLCKDLMNMWCNISFFFLLFLLKKVL